MRGIVLFFLLFGIFSTHVKAENIQIITTIKPITMLAYAIAGESAEISQLIPDYASVHDYSFKPSDLRKIRSANIIFRIDDHLEAIFTPIFDDLPSSISVISLAEENVIKLLSLDKNQKKRHGHQHGNTDLHIWTSPQNAIIMAKVIAQKLSEKDAERAKRYQKNLQIFIGKINAESLNARKKLLKLKNKPYIVFHNSWRYFQNDFNLEKPIVISFHESITPGIKTIRAIRKKIYQSNVACVFSDPSISQSRISTLIENYKINSVEIDTVGNEIKLDKNSYINWLKLMERRIDRCLGGNL